MLILGINAFHAEASASLVQDGRLVAAAEEERFTRIKHVAGFPSEAIRYCLSEAGAKPEDIGIIALSRNPWSHLWTKAGIALRQGPFSSAVRDRAGALLGTGHIAASVAETLGYPADRIRAKIFFVEHHRSHIASSFYPSGYESAVLLSLDGFGDSLSGMWGIGRGTKLRIDGEAAFPHSLGILYTAITQFLGFLSWGDEYKVMGLAPYGRPEAYRQALEKLAWESSRGGYRLGLEYFNHHTAGVSMSWSSGPPSLAPLFNSKIEKLLGPARKPSEPLGQRHSDIAAALQERLEAIVLPLLKRLGEKYRIPRLCYAGGVALNCTLNGKIRRETPFQEIFIQPAAHDSGTSLGAALYAAHHILGAPRQFTMTHAAWGPAAAESSIREALEKSGFPYRQADEETLCRTAAEALSQGKILGWFQGRMEFGPRALGHRSLLADPRDPKMKERINEKVKRRETFRPFAPSILTERVAEYFPEGHPDPFMLFTYRVGGNGTGKIPAVTHMDGTGRLQAVNRNAEGLYWSLIKAFEERSGVPVLLNTSFNEQEPIVCRPEEALDCFRRNAIDCLAVGPFWVERKT